MNVGAPPRFIPRILQVKILCTLIANIIRPSTTVVATSRIHFARSSLAGSPVRTCSQIHPLVSTMPPKRLPFRRPSITPRFAEANMPAQVPYVATPANSLSLFLTTSKAAFLRDAKEGRSKAAAWTVVMGNEAGDLDSIASAIAYAWIQSEVNKVPAVPLIQVERTDLALRAENLHALQLAGLSDTNEELLTLSEIADLKPFPAHKFALVDHSRLAERYRADAPHAIVTAIIDHHQDEGYHKDAYPRIFEACGSCASLVAALCPRELPQELATLLLSAMVIDMDGFRPGGKATQTDRDAANHIAVKSTLSRYLPPLSALAPIDYVIPDGLYGSQAIIELTQTLSQKKNDVSHLSAYDLLRRDYKEYTHALPWARDSPSIKVGLSTVPVGLKDWALDGRLEVAAHRWMRERGLTALGVLTTFNKVKKDGKSKHKREAAWILLEAGVDTGLLADRLMTGLEKASDLQFKRSKKFDLEASSKLPANAKTVVYKQGNARATRKAIAPLVKSILENL